MSNSLLIQAVQSSFLRLAPNTSANVVAYIHELIVAFEKGEICLDLSTINLPGKDELQNSDLVGLPGEFKPLIKDGNYLYFARYYAYQDQLVSWLLHSLKNPLEINHDELHTILGQIFADIDDQDLQYQATKTALTNKIAIVAGGPGTGKTMTVVKILAALLLQNSNLKIGLAAPTGKAAARMSEAIYFSLPKLKVDDELKHKIVVEAQTLHRLLGSSANSPAMLYNAKNPLNLDVVIVDEASMLDLALMAKLVSALNFQTRLILLGDAHQLSAVEAGAIFGDLCRTETKLAPVTTHLQVSHRFKDTSVIGNFVVAVKKGETAHAVEILEAQNQELTRCALDFNALKNYLLSKYQDFIASVKNTSDPNFAFQQFAKFRALCAHNDGKFGANSLNQYLDFYFRSQAKDTSNSMWYAGRPIIVLRNNYNLQLFNGDIGICLFVKNASNQVMPYVFFESNTGFKSFAPSRLPQYSQAFALTVHKSQGSEFNQVAVILADGQSELINRALLYTAVTRAKDCATIWSDLDVVTSAIDNHCQRISSLATKIA